MVIVFLRALKILINATTQDSDSDADRICCRIWLYVFESSDKARFCLINLCYQYMFLVIYYI